jgi:hypothetical protein
MSLLFDTKLLGVPAFVSSWLSRLRTEGRAMEAALRGNVKVSFRPGPEE